MAFFTEFKSGFIEGYAEITGALSSEYNVLINVFIFTLLISFYSIFTWKFYRFLSKKDLIELNLSQYNRTLHPILNKFFAVILYIIEYIVILPFIIFFWFAILALLILILSNELAISQVILAAAAIVASIRILAYYEEDLSRELAKIFPFTALVIFILSPGFFSTERIITNLSEVPHLLGNIIYFLVFIVAIELVLRVIDLFMKLSKNKEE